MRKVISTVKFLDLCLKKCYPKLTLNGFFSKKLKSSNCEKNPLIKTVQQYSFHMLLF